MSGATGPLPNTPSWRGDQLKICTGATLPLLYVLNQAPTLRHNPAPRPLVTMYYEVEISIAFV